MIRLQWLVAVTSCSGPITVVYSGWLWRSECEVISRTTSEASARPIAAGTNALEPGAGRVLCFVVDSGSVLSAKGVQEGSLE